LWALTAISDALAGVQVSRTDPRGAVMIEKADGGKGDSRIGDMTNSRQRILVSLRRIARTLDIHSRKLASDSNVTSVQLFTLKMLSMEGVDTATEAARRVHLSPSTVVGILDRLEEKGLIERRRDTVDRRVVRVTLTPEGRDLVASTPHPVEDLLSREYDGLSDEEAARIADSLETLVRVLGAGALDDDTPFGSLPSSDKMPGDKR
jgi:DNA-binding MarR family transcriptional regulator